MNRETAKELVTKYNNGLASEDERAILESWYDHQSEKLKLLDGDIDFTELETKIFLKTLTFAGLNRSAVVKPSYFRWQRIAVAACIFLILSVAAYLSFPPKNNRSEVTKAQDIPPGGNKAILTLASGKHIVLTGAHNGQLAIQNHAKILNTANGVLAYQQTDEKEADKIFYNTMSTPRGGQYSLILSDGTKVTLNAASSITYPVTFAGRERRVKLSGEAYFEVAHNKAMPFYVDSKNQDVRVLGTHFNIRAYDDELDINTTLLEGSIKIIEQSNPTNQKILIPGQQAALSPGKIYITNVDVNDAIAWKNGLFVFDDESLQHAMLKISRWYDITVVYQDQAVKMLTVGGSVSRFEHVSSILHLFEKSGRVHFELAGKTLFISTAKL